MKEGRLAHARAIHDFGGRDPMVALHLELEELTDASEHHLHGFNEP